MKRKSETYIHFDFSGFELTKKEISAHGKYLNKIKNEGKKYCCKRFEQAVKDGEIVYSYKLNCDIDETAWFIPGKWHLYFCPFCGVNIKESGYGVYDIEKESK